MAGTVTPAAGGPSVHRQRGVVRIEATLTTDATADGGDLTATEIGVAHGRLVAVYYDGGGDASAVITLKQKPGAAVAVPVWALTTGTEGTPASYFPTDIITTNAGANVTADATAPNVNRPIYVAGKLTLEVANMGVSESAKIAFVIDESGLAPSPLA